MADLISVLIPTRNRPLLARLCVETALANSDDDCEIVVADNGDEPLRLPVHPRLRVLPPEPKPLAMPDNWERALDAARGEWIMLLSDKYMLVPGGVEALRREATGGVGLIYYVYGIFRQHLDATETAAPASLGQAGGALSWPLPAASQRADSRRALERALASPGDYPVWAPMLYTALAHRTVVERARDQDGGFFFGPCPDIASALRLLAASDSYLVTRNPVIMAQYPSQSPEWSTGASTQADGDAGRAFLEQLGRDAGAGLERLVSVLMLLTLLEGRRRVPQLQSIEPGWATFAALAAREIEARPPGQRASLHWRLAKLVLLESRSPAPVWAQVRAAIGVHAPGFVLHAYRRLQPRAGPQPDTTRRLTGPVEAVSSREQALDRLARVVREDCKKAKPTVGPATSCPEA